MDDSKLITLGLLKQRLAEVWKLPDDTEIFFGAGDLSYNDWHGYKRRANGEPTLVNIEFNEVYSVVPDPNDAA